MKKTSTIFILIILLNYVQAQMAYPCSKYKFGTFKMIDVKSNIQNKIERTSNKQMETDLNSGKYISFDILWISDCEYELKSASGTLESVNFFKGKTLIIKVKETYPNGYKFEGHIKGTNIYRSHYMSFMN